MPPTAPIVTFEPNTISDLIEEPPEVVFVSASNGDGKLTANSVAVGTRGARRRRCDREIVGDRMTLASSAARPGSRTLRPSGSCTGVAAAAILGFKRSRHLQRLAEPTLHLPGLEDPRSLRRYAWSLLRDGSEADDLVQDSLVRALDRILSRISLVCEVQSGLWDRLHR